MKIVTKNFKGDKLYNIKNDNGELLFSEYQFYICQVGDFFIIDHNCYYNVINIEGKDAFTNSDTLTYWKQAFAFANKYIIVEYPYTNIRKYENMNILSLDGAKMLEKNIDYITPTENGKYALINEVNRECFFSVYSNVLNNKLEKIFNFDAKSISYISEKDLFNVQTESGWQLYNNKGELVFPKNGYSKQRITYIEENETYIFTNEKEKNIIYDNNFQPICNGLCFDNLCTCFRNGFYTVEYNGKWNYIDIDGNFLIKDNTLNIVHANAFHNGYGIIYIQKIESPYKLAYDGSSYENIYAKLVDSEGNFVVKSNEFTDFRTFKGCVESEYFIGCKRCDSGYGFTQLVYLKGSEELYSQDLSIVNK